MTDKTLRSANGAPVVDKQQQPHRRPPQPRPDARHLVDGETRPLRPRAHSRAGGARHGAPGAYGTFTVTTTSAPSARPTCSTPSAGRPRCSWASPPWPARRGRRRRAGRARLLPLVYTEQATGIWWQQPRCSSFAIPEIPRLHPHPEAGSRTNLRSATAAWDFWSRHPESLHQVTILFSDRGIPRSLREMNGYGSHTFSFINSANERFWVKFHFKTE